jgi:hypothetical protein
MAAGGGQPITTEITVEFPRGSAPAPAFCSFSIVHRFPEYVVLDLGAIDPLQMQPVPGAGGHKAMLQHIARVCLPDSTAKQLWQELGTALGMNQAAAPPQT